MNTCIGHTTKRPLVTDGDYCRTANYRIRDTRDILGCTRNFSAIFQNTYLFIPQIIAEPIKIFCGTLFGKF